MRRAISWTILSSVQLIPRGRVVPSSLGISTRRTGWGRYDIWDSFVCSACKWVSRCCAYISFVTPSTPGAFVPSSAAKHARRLSTVKWCINAVKGAVGWLRARWAIRSTPVVVVAPPLRVADVAIERATGCAPLCSAGVTPLRRSYEGIRLPLDRWLACQCAGCTILPPSLEEPRGPPEFPTLPCARATVFDPGGFAGTVAVGPSDVAFRVTKHVGTHGSSHNGAQSLHVCALRPVHSLCTLRRPRYR